MSNLGNAHALFTIIKIILYWTRQIVTAVEHLVIHLIRREKFYGFFIRSVKYQCTKNSVHVLIHLIVVKKGPFGTTDTQYSYYVKDKYLEKRQVFPKVFFMYTQFNYTLWWRTERSEANNFPLCIRKWQCIQRIQYLLVT